MKIRCVTLTGADDNTDILAMSVLSEQYPYVEWGILLSNSKSGNSRYPSLNWVRRLASNKTAGMNCACHLCGSWARDVLQSSFSFMNNDFAEILFNRIQLNFGSQLGSILANQAFWNGINWVDPGKSILLGGHWTDRHRFWSDKLHLYSVCPLFDMSGGKGKSPDLWLKPFEQPSGQPLFCGYAGGLGPENIVAELARIETVVGDAEIWIDMETKLRSEDKFDLGRCEEILKAVKPWIVTS